MWTFHSSRPSRLLFYETLSFHEMLFWICESQSHSVHDRVVTKRSRVSRDRVTGSQHLLLFACWGRGGGGRCECCLLSCVLDTQKNLIYVDRFAPVSQALSCRERGRVAADSWVWTLNWFSLTASYQLCNYLNKRASSGCCLLSTSLFFF